MTPVPIQPSIQARWAVDEGGDLADVITRRRAWLMFDADEAPLLVASIERHTTIRRHDEAFTNALGRVAERIRSALAARKVAPQ